MRYLENTFDPFQPLIEKLAPKPSYGRIGLVFI